MNQQNSMNYILKKTVKEWNYAPELDSKKFFLAIIKSAVSAACGNMENVALGGVEMLDAIGLSKEETDWKDDTWRLIMTSLLDSMRNLIEDNNDLFPNNFEINEDAINNSVAEFDSAEITIGLYFTEHPEKIEIIAPAQTVLQKLLEEAGISSRAAKHIAERLPDQFVFSLRKEWMNNAEKYQRIRTALECPFNEAVKKKELWDIYLAYQQTIIKERVFDAFFSLDKIYIPLRGYVEIKEKNEELPITDYKRTAFYLMEHVEKWLSGNEKLLFIKGEPGCGKTSFSRMLSSKLAASGKKVIFIPLQNIILNSNFSRSVEDYLSEQKHFNRDSEVLNEAAVLILDGLDEISEAGSNGEKAASDFMSYLRKSSSNSNSYKIIVTGRSLAIESVERWYDGKNGVINILGYLINQNEFDIYDKESQNIIKIDQRVEWWERYNVIREKGKRGLPDFLNNNYQSRGLLLEISAQPLLNYLLALAVESEIEFSQEANINSVYSHLLSEFNKKFSTSKYEELNIQPDDFSKFLMEVAICAWHGGEVRRTSWDRITKRCNSTELEQPFIKVLNKYGSEPHTKLLVSFYFGSAGSEQNGEKAFEFTHKSFGEYLAAKRIVEEFSKLHAAFDVLGIESFLHKWVSMFGPSPIDMDLLAFIRREIHQRSKDHVAEWQKRLILIINYVLQKSFPKSTLTDCGTFKDMRIQARNAEESLFVILNICAKYTKTVSDIDWPESTSFGEFVCRIRGQRNVLKNCTVLNCLSYLNLAIQTFDLIDLYKANMEYSNLTAIYCRLGILYGAYLEGANLNGATFEGANLEGAKLEGANLNGANLEGANLEGANLEGAYLKVAYLEGANLEGANLEGAKLEGANLKGAKLEGAKLEGANLEGANLEGAHLEGAHLKGVNLEGAHLEGAHLEGAYLERSHLAGAHLEGAYLEGAYLERSHLEGANLEGVNFIR